MGLTKKFHPDVNPGKENELVFSKVLSAYDILNDPKKRLNYNWKTKNDPYNTGNFRSGFSSAAGPRYGKKGTSGARPGQNQEDYRKYREQSAYHNYKRWEHSRDTKETASDSYVGGGPKMGFIFIGGLFLYVAGVFDFVLDPIFKPTKEEMERNRWKKDEIFGPGFGEMRDGQTKINNRIKVLNQEKKKKNFTIEIVDDRISLKSRRRQADPKFVNRINKVWQKHGFDGKVSKSTQGRDGNTSKQVDVMGYYQNSEGTLKRGGRNKNEGKGIFRGEDSVKEFYDM